MKANTSTTIIRVNCFKFHGVVSFFSTREDTYTEATYYSLLQKSYQNLDGLKWRSGPRLLHKGLARYVPVRCNFRPFSFVSELRSAIFVMHGRSCVHMCLSTWNVPPVVFSHLRRPYIPGSSSVGNHVTSGMRYSFLNTRVNNLSGDK